MKASDLMIGDWVYDTHSYNYNKEKEPVKLDRNEFAELICGCTGNNDLDLGDMYEPIPLTKDILAKAGYFCQQNDGDSWYISFSGSKRHIGTVKVKYLHELQQFRRLCGKEEISIEL